ncbi:MULTISPECIES: fumarylacetoacetase [Streptomyces]|uniref:fumarylacetoacetase n=1 Tax=Streptomyces albus (strain ATCC 21838 / DSM 41398 / FERM P-419 / JCM 4703 / NBRC 107858) TaxID=1081613 RepID=A0A0B5EWG0_STRA4|nr:fumarylacetoacetase [Streptomyces sp. SCSIO ZS0520]AJE83021.1 fumarylacetoacetase [Streptomyces albus]AOU77331.1 fumarylacetoacetase [Streptomyces albus]AYN33107.1 fumarylacetoacetase [Streptomyces albus]
MPEQQSADSPFDLAEGHPFGPHNLPYGVFSPGGSGERRVGVRLGEFVLDAGAVAGVLGSPHAGVLSQATLNPLMAAGRGVWSEVRRELTAWVTESAYRETAAAHFHPLAEVALHLPFEVADYVDFYASENHARNLGRLFRPDAEDSLMPNWKHLPVGYHGRAGTVVVSGTEVVRPSGQRKTPADPVPVFGASVRLDIETEVGFVVGVPTEIGQPVALADFREHVFGLTLLNDWSARDIQAWEYVPLGPHLGKSFATSVSAWITPLEALDAARIAPPARTHELLPYLDDTLEELRGEPGGYDLRITVELNGQVISEPPFSTMYWTAAQQLAHMTVNGASLRTGDLYGSGTVSGGTEGERGSLLELSWGGKNPLELPGGKRTFLEDGDEVTMTAWAPGPGGTRVALGEVRGRIAAAR